MQLSAQQAEFGSKIADHLSPSRILKYYLGDSGNTSDGTNKVKKEKWEMLRFIGS